jgi:hypothetical protein
MNLEKQSNPYAPPQSPSVQVVSDHCWRDGKMLVVPIGNQLPPRCVKCNAPAKLDKPRAFAWHHPGWYVLIPLNLLVYAVAATLVQKRAKIALGLCAAHRARRRKFTLAAVGLLLLAIGAMYFALEGEDALFGSLSVLFFLAGLIVAIVGSRALTASRISKEQARLKGAGPAFLDSLPSR